MPEQPSGRVRDKAAKFLGQKSGLPIESYGIDAAEQIKNFVLYNGELKKINGCEIYADVLNGQVGGISSLHRFKNLWVAQRGSALAFEIDEGQKSFLETLKTNLSSTARLYSSSWRDRIFFANGVDCDMCLNRADSLSATKYGTLGLDPPPNFLGGSSIGIMTPGDIYTDGDGNVPGGSSDTTYYYFLTLFDSETNTESPAFGAQLGQDGLYELSPNGVMGPLPIGSVVVAAGASKKIHINGSLALWAYLTYAQTVVPRATHFIMYRGTKLSDGTYDPAAIVRVPQKNGGRQDGNYFVHIGTFIADGDEFIDNTATPPVVNLPTNNSPPATKSRAQAAYDWAHDKLQITTSTFDATQATSFRHMKVFRDQLFGIGASSPGYSVSEITFGADKQRITGTINDFRDLLHGSEVYQPDYMTYLWEVGRGDGQKGIALSVLSDVALLVHKEKSTYYLSGSSPDNYVLRIMDTQKGCVHQSTQQETPVGAITLDRGGFVLWSKIGIGERISLEIQDVVDGILFQYSSSFYSCFDPKFNRYYCAVATAGSSGNPNLTLCLDLNSMQWTQSQGTEGLSRHIDTGSDDVFVDLTGSSTNGRLLDFSNETNADNQGTPIEATWTSGSINFNDDQRKKKAQWLYIRAKSASSWKVDIYVIPDYDESRAYILKDIDVVAFQSTWYSSDLASDGTLLWSTDDTGSDGGKWASDRLIRQVAKIPIKAIGYNFQIRIVNKEADSARYGFAIESVSLEGVLFGR